MLSIRLNLFRIVIGLISLAPFFVCLPYLIFLIFGKFDPCAGLGEGPKLGTTDTTFLSTFRSRLVVLTTPCIGAFYALFLS
jgi:hypothetical protein